MKGNNTSPVNYSLKFNTGPPLPKPQDKLYKQKFSPEISKPSLQEILLNWINTVMRMISMIILMKELKEVLLLYFHFAKSTGIQGHTL